MLPRQRPLLRHHTLLYCAVPCHTILHPSKLCTILCCTVLNTAPYHTIARRLVMLHTALDGNTVLDYAALSYIILYCILYNATARRPDRSAGRPGRVCSMHSTYGVHSTHSTNSNYTVHVVRVVHVVCVFCTVQ